jgi:hypothetical protein
MIFNVICAGIGITLFVLFLGTIIVWVKPIPFAIIVIGVVAMMIYDLVLSLRDSSR